MTEKEIFLSVVIPAYKEEKRIQNILSAIESYQRNKTFKMEILVVIDASPDDTKGAAMKYEKKIDGLRIIDNKIHQGKGGVVRQGVLEAKGKLVLFSDADNATPIQELDKLLPYIKDNEVVIGSRYCKGGKLVISQPFYRRLGSRVINLIIRMITGLKIYDTQCGFKLFESDAAKKIFEKEVSSNFSFDIEVLMLAKYFGFRTKEVGVNWYDHPHSTVNPIKDGLKLIANAFTVKKKIKNKEI